MGIDWEGLLGAEGDELQDAYDEAVAAWDEPYEPPEEENWREDLRAKRRIVRFRSEDKAENKAVQEALSTLFHTEFAWMCFGSKADRPFYLTEDDGTKTLMEDGRLRVENARNRVVMTDGLGRIVLLSKELSRMVLDRHDEASVCDCIADVRRMEYPFREKHVRDLKHEYDADGMPVRVYGDYYECFDNGYHYETIEDKDYTVWLRSDYQEEYLIWVFQRVQSEEKLVLKPVEIWNMDYGPRAKLIWQSRL